VLQPLTQAQMRLPVAQRLGLNQSACMCLLDVSACICLLVCVCLSPSPSFFPCFLPSRPRAASACCMSCAAPHTCHIACYPVDLSPPPPPPFCLPCTAASSPNDPLFQSKLQENPNPYKYCVLPMVGFHQLERRVKMQGSSCACVRHLPLLVGSLNLN
jgi:hypothetical protein